MWRGSQTGAPGASVRVCRGPRCPSRKVCECSAEQHQCLPQTMIQYPSPASGHTRHQGQTGFQNMVGAISVVVVELPETTMYRLGATAAGTQAETSGNLLSKIPLYYSAPHKLDGASPYSTLSQSALRCLQTQIKLAGRCSRACRWLNNQPPITRVPPVWSV